MVENVIGVDALIKAFGIGVPAAVAVLTFLIVSLVLRFLGNKQDKDRTEHMAKWQSMIEMQNNVMKNNEESSTALVKSHQDQIDNLIKNHRDENDRQYRLHERQAQAIEALAHHLAAQTQILQTKHFCPNQNKEG